MARLQERAELVRAAAATRSSPTSMCWVQARSTPTSNGSRRARIDVVLNGLADGTCNVNRCLSRHLD